MRYYKRKNYVVYIKMFPWLKRVHVRGRGRSRYVNNAARPAMNPHICFAETISRASQIHSEDRNS